MTRNVQCPHSSPFWKIRNVGRNIIAPNAAVPMGDEEQRKRRNDIALYFPVFISRRAALESSDHPET
jgi:hypothetical protein